MLQARAVGELTATFFQHLPFETDELPMRPLDLLEAAAPLFKPDPALGEPA